MPLLREYRLVLPMSVDEYHKGRCWHEANNLKLDLKACKEDPVQFQKHSKTTVLQEEVCGIPFAGTLLPDVIGEHKIERVRPFSASWNSDKQLFLQTIGFIEEFAGLFLLEKIKLTEFESWDAFPYHRSIGRTLDKKGFGKSCEVINEVVCLPGNGQLENALNLPPSMLKHRHVHVIDIANKVAEEDYNPANDPALFQSTKTGRGFLKPGKWIRAAEEPVMTCYILVTVNFGRYGLSHISERKLQNKLLRRITLNHREMFCGIDNWIDTPLAELITEERELRSELEMVIMEPPRSLGKQPNESGDVLLDIGEEDDEEEEDTDATCSLGQGGAMVLAVFIIFGLLVIYTSDL